MEDKLKETAELVNQYSHIVSDYKRRVGLIKSAKDMEALNMELKTIKMFEQNLRELEPEIGKKILELQLHIN